MIYFNNDILFHDSKSILICGPKRAGKTALAVQIALYDRADRIAENIGIDAAKARAWRWKRKDKREFNHKCWFQDPTTKEGFELHHYDLANSPDGTQYKLGEHKCSIRVHDEMPIEYQARDFKGNSMRKKLGIESMKEDGKADARQVSTTQMYRDLDVLPAGNHQIVIQVRGLVNLPFIGWIWPDSKIPEVWCEDCRKLHRYSNCSKSALFGNWLGFGTAILWDRIDPDLSQSGRSQLMTDENVIIGTGLALWSQEAAECYRTFSKVQKRVIKSTAPTGRDNKGGIPAKRGTPTASPE